MSEIGKKRKRKGERPDGRIQLTVNIGYDPVSGKPLRKSFYGHSRAEAERKRKAFLDAQNGGLEYTASAMTVSQWIDKWIELYEVRSEEYAPYISRIRNEFGMMNIKGVTEGMLVQSLRQFKGKSKSGATKYRMILKQCFHSALRNHVIADDPAEDLKIPETTEGTHRPLERWEIETIINNWRLYPAGRWAMLMLLCGLRRGEMAALQWDCVDMESRTITVKRAASFSGGHTVINDQTKTEAGMRRLPICDDLFFMLDETPQSERKGFVCLSATGKQISSTTVERNWDTYCKIMTRFVNGQKCLLKGFRFDLVNSKGNLEKTEIEPFSLNYNRLFDIRMHDLRHTFATMLYMSGVDVKAAQYYLGHSDLRMTMNLYTHLTAENEAKKRTAFTGYLDAYLRPDAN